MSSMGEHVRYMTQQKLNQWTHPTFKIRWVDPYRRPPHQGHIPYHTKSIPKICIFYLFCMSQSFMYLSNPINKLFKCILKVFWTLIWDQTNYFDLIVFWNSLCLNHLTTIVFLSPSVIYNQIKYTFHFPNSLSSFLPTFLSTPYN